MYTSEPERIKECGIALTFIALIAVFILMIQILEVPSHILHEETYIFIHLMLQYVALLTVVFKGF